MSEMLRIYKILMLGFYFFIYFSILIGAEKVKYVSVEHPEVNWINPKYIRYANMTARRYSRGDPVHYVSCNFDLIWPVHYNINIHYVFYEYLSNQYKPSFVELRLSMCDLIENDIFFGITFSKFFSHRCPLDAGPYHISNVTVPLKNVPPNFPFSKGRVTANATSNSRELLAYFYVDIEIKELSTRRRKNRN